MHRKNGGINRSKEINEYVYYLTDVVVQYVRLEESYSRWRARFNASVSAIFRAS